MVALAGLLLALLFYASSSFAAFEQVLFKSLDNETELTAFLSQPDGDGPFPAVVMLHGCGGMGYSGTVSALYTSWAELFAEQGMVALVVDSAGSRNLGPTCGRGQERRKMYRVRPFDAYAALAYLQGLELVKPDRVGLVGWSQGGGIVLLTIDEKSIARPDPQPNNDFAAAAAFYPALCNDKLQSRPFTKVEPNSWSTKIPFLVLQGGADNWAVPEPCVNFIEAARNRGNPVSITVYPGAYHGFDAPAVKKTELKRYKTVTGVIPIVGTDIVARKEAQKALSAFLQAYLLPKN